MQTYESWCLESFAYNSVNLVSLANDNKYEVDPNSFFFFPFFFFQVVKPSIKFKILLCPKSALL